MQINDNGTTRDMTDDEVKNLQIIKLEHETLKQAEADRQALKTATLAKLGLTADEVTALLS